MLGKTGGNSLVEMSCNTFSGLYVPFKEDFSLSYIPPACPEYSGSSPALQHPRPYGIMLIKAGEEGKGDFGVMSFLFPSNDHA